MADDPVYGSPEANQDAVDDLCVVMSRAEVDLEKAMISIGAIPQGLKKFRTYIQRHVVMLGNKIPDDASEVPQNDVSSFYRPIGDAQLSAGHAMEYLRLLHLQLEHFRIQCNLPAPQPGALAGGGGGKG